MSEAPYKRKPGDFELRVLRDGRLVLVAADEELLNALGDVAMVPAIETGKETTGHDRDECRCQTRQ